MNTVYELLAQKEKDLSRVHKEVECLRIAATLLSDGDEVEGGNDRRPGEILVTPDSDHSVLPAEEGIAEESTVRKVMGMFRKRTA